MQTTRIAPRTNVIASLMIILTLGMQSTASALAQESSAPKTDDAQLQPLQPSVDTTVPTPEKPALDANPDKPVLNGQVSKEEEKADKKAEKKAEKEAEKEAERTAQAARFMQQHMGNDRAQAFASQLGNLMNNGTGGESGGSASLGSQLQNLQELLKAARASGNVKVNININGGANSSFDPSQFFGASEKPKMSPEEFRKLEYGVVGMESTVIGHSRAEVIKVEPYGPAAKEGILPGDEVVQAGEHVFQPGEGQREIWHAFAGKAGTQLDVTVLRGAKLLTFHLIRMNIEDIPDPNRRLMYEIMLSHYGAPNYEADAAPHGQ
jgi:C-terminal processing protease CtpA/Prc